MFQTNPGPDTADPLAFASGGGDIGALLRTHDWSRTALGPIAGWSPALRITVGIMLNAGEPAYVAWGPDFRLLFNDTYRVMLGARGSDPARLLGQPFREVWPEIRDDVQPLFEAALAGQASWADDHPMVLHRNGYPEQAWIRFSATPVREANGQVAGVFGLCSETTGKVVSRRERDAALATLAQREQTLEIAADAAEFGLFEHDLRSSTANWSPCTRAHFGVQDGVPVDAATFGHALHLEDRERVRAEIAAMLAAPPPDGRYRGEYRTVGPGDGDGGVRWIAVRGRLVLDDDGRPSRLVGATLDVTKRREAEVQASASAEANAKFRAFFDQATSFAALLSLEGRVVEINRAALESAHYRREDVLGLPFWECGWWLPSAELSATVREGTLAAASGATLRQSLPYFAADGSRRHTDLALAPVLDDAGRVLFVAATGADITEQRQVEERLRLLDEIGEATRIAAEPKAIMREATRLLGQHMGVTRVAYADLEPDNDRFTIRHDWHVEGVQSTVGVYSLDLFGSRATSHLRVGHTLLVNDVDRELAAADGADMFNAIGIKAIICCPLVKGGRLVAMMAVHQAAPRVWQEAEVALVEAVVERCWAHIERVRGAEALVEADRRKSEFLATLAHELRNPLAPIRNGLEILRSDAARPELQAKVRAMMERQVGHMVHLINDLLDIARVSSGKVVLQRERVALRDVVASAVETSLPAIESAGHALEVDLPDAPLFLHADKVRISQVLGNLLSNAAKYTPRGGRIRVGARAEGADILIVVDDNGIGIAPEALPRVFDMFTQVGGSAEQAKGGLGIGLALVRHLVQLHGGMVGAHSPGPGLGSSFTVRLPAHAVHDGAPPPAAVAQATPAAPAPLRVLVADDNIDAADSLASLLRLGGHTLRVAHEGEAAVRLAAEFSPDIAFLDIGMPRLDGHGAARAIRALPGLQDVFLVALTGWGAEDDRRRSREAGFDAHLLKPAVPEEVAALVERAGHSVVRG